MKFTLLVVGKTVEKHYIAAINDYTQRIKHYIPFDIEVIPELKNTKSLSEEQQKEKEGELILKALQPGDVPVLLDEHGKENALGQTACVHHRWSLRILACRIRSGARKDFTIKNDFLTSDDTPHLHRAALPGNEHSEQQPVSSRINENILLLLQSQITA